MAFHSPLWLDTQRGLFPLAQPESAAAVFEKNQNKSSQLGECLQNRLNLFKGISQRELSNFIAVTGEGVVSLDNRGCLQSMNSEAERLLGWSSAELQGKDFFAETQLSFADISTLGCAPCPSLNSVSCSHLNVGARVRHRNGSRLVVNFMLSSLFESGRVVGKVFVFQEAEQAESVREPEAGLLAAAASVVIRLDKSGRVVFANEQGRWLFGEAPPQSYLPETIVSLLQNSPHQLDQQTLLDRRWSEHGQREVCLAWSVALLRDAAGAISGAVCIANDCTDHALFEKIQLQEGLLTRRVFEHLSDGLISVDCQGRVQYLNPTAEQLTGWTSEEAEGLPLKDVYHVVDEHTQESREDPLGRCLRERACVESEGVGMLLRRDGWEFSVKDRVLPVRGADEVLQGAIVLFSDLSELRGMERWMEYEANHDALTGLINRRQFEAHAQAALESAIQEGREHALFYLDLDQFKIINDSYGHQAGDQLLKGLSRLLASQLEEDVSLARLGGDEFGIILENCPLGKAKRLAKALCRAIRDYQFVWENKPFEIGVSIGLVPITAKSKELGELMRVADSACYVAKEQGGNRVHVYQPSDSALRQREGEMQWIQHIRQALAQNRFRLYCQNIVPLGIGAKKAGHYEILLRMLDPEGNVVRPAAFIAAAERYHYMPDIDRWVISNALQLLGKRRQRREENSVFSINLSGQSLDDESLLGFVIDQLEQNGVPAEMVCFEITETAAASNMMVAGRFMTVLRGMGCRFALDDFGKGISSFAYLKNIQVDYIKIDGMFVKNLADDKVGHAMVESINHIGHTMGVQTIAEFVETQAVLEKLIDMGVDHVQGYQLGRPRPLLPAFRSSDSTQ